MELVKCRLCTSSEELIEIFSEDGEARNLAHTINQCLPVVVHPDDYLPTLICLPCISKLEDVYKFWKGCEDAYIMLESAFRVQKNATHDPRDPLEDEALAAASEKDESTEVKKSSRQLSHLKMVSENSDQGKENSEQMCVSAEPEVIMQELHLPSESTDDVVFKVREPRVGDYVLVKEETFELAKDISNREPSDVTDKYLEFYREETDTDILDFQLKRKEKLPQMWDVFEKNSSDSTVTHRRYIISKLAFSCSLCGQCYDVSDGVSRNNEVNQSLDSSENRSGLEFPCNVCGKVFPRRSSLKRHVTLHGDFKPFPCYVCGRAFNRKEHLSRHALSHIGVRSYNCDICLRPFTRKEHLSRHKNITHFREIHGSSVFIETDAEPEEVKKEVDDCGTQKFTCSFCGQAFSQIVELNRHQKTSHWNLTSNGSKHPVLRPYGCVVCTKTFTRKEHLVRHHKIHERQYAALQAPEFSNSVLPSKHSFKGRSIFTNLQGVEVRPSGEEVSDSEIQH